MKTSGIKAAAEDWLHSGFVFYIALALAAFGLDRISKWIVTHTMTLQQSLSLIDSILQFTYVRNPGAAFSLLAEANAPWRLAFLIGVKAAAVVVLTAIAFRERHQHRLLMFPLGMVSGGALGNLMDRLTSGTVVDFIEVSYRSFHWPVFNLADSAVVVGVCWLVLLTFKHQPGSLSN